MRYAVRHKESEQFLYVGEESGPFLTDDGKYGVITYRSKKYAEEFLKELFEYGGIYDEGGTVDDEMTIEDFEVVTLGTDGVSVKGVKDEEIEEPIGSFIIENIKGVQTPNGEYYYYGDVCKLLRLYEKKLKGEL